MNPNPKDDLQHIRNMMERSSRFISLSGLSGVVAGAIALAGAGAAWYLFRQANVDYFDGYRDTYTVALVEKLAFLAIAVLILAIGFGIWLTVRKSKKSGLQIWSATTRNLLVALMIPLVTGGLFCLAMLYHGVFAMVTPATLVFYGLALVNASKYTFSDIQYLGYCEIFLGLVSAFLVGYGLVFWALGFGLLHIIYGIVMYRKYDQPKK